MAGPSSLILLMAAVAVLCSAVPSMQAVGSESVRLDQQDTFRLDRDKVRYGNDSTFDAKAKLKVGTVRSTEVYESIPAWKTIKKEGVQAGTARWQQLMAEATEAFKAALRTVASNNSYVLIVEEGGISGYEQVSDCTAAVVAAL